MTERVAYRPTQAAKVTGLSERTIRYAIASGELPSSRRGKARLILHDDLVAWVRAGRLEPVTPALPATSPGGRAALERLGIGS